MEPDAEPLTFYGAPTDRPQLEWSWVQQALETAGTYWVIASGQRAPHPRPVWGVWINSTLALSLGSPTLSRRLEVAPAVTVHLDSGTDVVIIEGQVAELSGASEIVAAYQAKYDWHYDLEQYGPFKVVSPTIVRAWRSSGWAGRDGFQTAGRWRFA
jgi:hypothetical protein